MRADEAVLNIRQNPRVSTARAERRLAALAHLRALADISGEEANLVQQSASEPSLATTGAELVRAGAELNQPRVILTGWSGLSVFLPDGRRQFLDFALPGDLIGFSPRVDAVAKATIVALTTVETIKLPALTTALSAPQRLPGLIQVLQHAQDRFEDRLLNQIVRNGCQSALEKLCSLLFELYARLCATGVADRNTFTLPISQVVIADALGLSTVHVNRTFQHLRREHIVQTEGHRLTILNPAALRKLAGRLRLPKGLGEFDEPPLRSNAT